MAHDKDRLFCELFENLKILGDLRKSYDQTASEGYIQLSKAQLQQGMSFGSLQYPNSMTALVEIELIEELFNFIPLTQDETTTTQNNLRQRNVKNKVETITHVDDTSTQTKPSNDPIHWFTGLPPQSLRMSQKHFKKSIEILVGIANTQKQIKRLMEKISSLSKDT